MIAELVILGIVGVVGGFVGGVLASNRVHEVETRLRNDVVAVETRLRSALDSLRK